MLTGRRSGPGAGEHLVSSVSEPRHDGVARRRWRREEFAAVDRARDVALSEFECGAQSRSLGDGDACAGKVGVGEFERCAQSSGPPAQRRAAFGEQSEERGIVEGLGCRIALGDAGRERERDLDVAGAGAGLGHAGSSCLLPHLGAGALLLCGVFSGRVRSRGSTVRSLDRPNRSRGERSEPRRRAGADRGLSFARSRSDFVPRGHECGDESVPEAGDQLAGFGADRGGVDRRRREIRVPEQ